MKIALTKLKNSRKERWKSDTVLQKRILEKSWEIYPHKLKFLLSVYGGQSETDSEITDLHNSLDEMAMQGIKK